MSKATLYLDDGIYRALKIRAAEQDRSMSDLVNEALAKSLRPGSQPSEAVGPQLVSEGALGLPVLSVGAWPAGWSLDRGDLYE